MHKVDKLAQELLDLISEGKFAEAMVVHAQLGEVLETYKWCC